MYLGECHKIQDWHHLHGNENAGKNYYFLHNVLLLLLLFSLCTTLCFLTVTDGRSPNVKN